MPTLTKQEGELLEYFSGSLPPVQGVGFLTLEDWPVYLRPLVEQHGGQSVWDSGIAANGFPPTWVRGAAEAGRVEEHLKKSLGI